MGPWGSFLQSCPTHIYQSDRGSPRRESDFIGKPGREDNIRHSRGHHGISSSGTRCVLQSQAVEVILLQQDGTLHEPGQAPPPRNTPALGATALLTLAWYSLMKGWALCASFSCDMYLLVTCGVWGVLARYGDPEAVGLGKTGMEKAEHGTPKSHCASQTRVALREGPGPCHPNPEPGSPVGSQAAGPGTRLA